MVAYAPNTLLIDDTFTRSGALGSTEGGSLGPLAWQGDTGKLACNGTEARAIYPANAVGVEGVVYVNVPAGLSVRVAVDTATSSVFQTATKHGIVNNGGGTGWRFDDFLAEPA